NGPFQPARTLRGSERVIDGRHAGLDGHQHAEPMRNTAQHPRIPGSAALPGFRGYRRQWPIDRWYEGAARRVAEPPQGRTMPGYQSGGVAQYRHRPRRRRYRCFIDDDAIADPCWLERIVAGYDQPKIGAGGGMSSIAAESG